MAETAHFDRSFTIEVNGRFVVNPPKDSEDEWILAKVGDRSDAAVFKLEAGYLSSGDLYMGRFHIESTAYIPKKVFWVKDHHLVQQCQNSGTEKEPELKSNGL
jgi:hypothetical protein